MSTEVAALLVATLSIAVVALIGAFTESEFSNRFASVAEAATDAALAVFASGCALCMCHESRHVHTGSAALAYAHDALISTRVTFVASATTMPIATTRLGPAMTTRIARMGVSGGTSRILRKRHNTWSALTGRLR